MADVDKIKDQFARFLYQNDWMIFKTMAEYYLQSAASLKKRNMNVPDDDRLWMRNSVKRLFLGIGCELLLKSFYLKNGYCINKPKQKGIKAVPTHKFETINPKDFNYKDTYTFGTLLDHLRTLHQFKNHEQIHRGFTIAMVFRNKEGHTTFIRHNFDPQNYTDIEAGIILFYKEAFKEKLDFKISMTSKDQAMFKIS